MAELLKVEHLKKYFSTPAGMLHAVDDVSFTIEEGKTLGVVGLAGSIAPFREISPYILRRDLPVLIVLSVSIALFPLFGKGKVPRLAGTVWIAAYAAYLALMIGQEVP